jgi:hypothetical protein
MVGTVKKSTETMDFTWLSRKVRQVCEGGWWRRFKYLLTLVSVDAQFEQLAVNPRSAPEWVLAR